MMIWTGASKLEDMTMTGGPFLLGLCLLLFSVPVATLHAGADVPGNDDMASAEAFPGSGSATGSLNGTDTVDVLYVDVDGGAMVELDCYVGPDGNGTLRFELRAGDGKVLVSTGDLVMGGSGTVSYVTSAEAGGRYHPVALLTDGDNATYTMVLGTSMQDDGGSGGDVPGTSEKALELDLSTRAMVQGQVGPENGTDKNDMYVVQVPPLMDLRFKVRVEAPGYELWFELHRNTITVLPFFRGFLDHTASLDETRSVTEDTTFYLNVIWENGARATYHLEVWTEPTPDTEAPVLEVGPLPTTTQDAGLTINGTLVDDRGADRVEVVVNGGQVMDCTGVGTWTCEVDLVEGLNSITVTGYDKWGNKDIEGLEIEYRPFVPPRAIGLTVDSPSDGEVVKEATLELAGTVSPANGPRVRCSVDGGMTWYDGVVGLEGAGRWTCVVVLAEGGERHLGQCHR